MNPKTVYLTLCVSNRTNNQYPLRNYEERNAD